MGLTLTVEDATCTVVGVFSGERLVILRPDTGEFTAAELQNLPRGEDGYRLAESVCLASGLGCPDEILWGSGFAGWVWLLPWSCLLVAGFRLLLSCVKGIRKLPVNWRGLLCLGVSFLVVIILQVVLNRLPPWLIPTRWSDFDFWIRLFETLRARCEDALSLTPMTRDTEAKIAVIRVILLSLGSRIVLLRMNGFTRK